jgi:phage baseplate assembly protein W
MPLPITYYDPTLAQWPDLARGAIPLAPVRVGMDRFTGKMLIGWPHVRQSMVTIFATRFHERVLRRWVGSFVPHILGESAVPRIITRFFWAIASAIDLWEPCYAIQRVRIMNRDGSAPMSPPEQLTSAEEVRRGEVTTQAEGVYRPRGHLGDFTPERRRKIGFVGRGNGLWQ